MLSADGVQVTAPYGFRRAQAPVIPGLDFKEPLSVASGQAGIVAGVLPDATGPSLLPERFVSGLGTPPATDKRVKLGDLEAVRYEALRPNGFDRPLTLYVVPLREGAAAVACFDAGPRCDQTAASLKLEGHEALPVGPSAAFAEDVEALADDLQAARTAAEKALDRARTRSAQADALAHARERLPRRRRNRPRARPGRTRHRPRDHHEHQDAGDAYAAAARAARAGQERALRRRTLPREKRGSRAAERVRPARGRRLQRRLRVRRDNTLGP